MFFQSSDGYNILKISNSDTDITIELGDPKSQKGETASLKVGLDVSQAWNLHKALGEFLNAEIEEVPKPKTKKKGGFFSFRRQ